VKNVYFLEFKVCLPNGKSETRRVKFDRQDQLLAFFEKAFSVEFKNHELGKQVDIVEGQRSSYYHFAFVDRRTGKRYLPYTEKDGKRVYLDLRHVLATKEFAQNMAVEVFLVFDHREPEGTLTTRYDGLHAAFQLDEFTSADLRMADIGRMMRKYYLGSMGEECRFHYLQWRTFADSAGKKPAIPSPVFSFDGFAFSFSLPASAARDEAPVAVPERIFGAPEPEMVLESQSWFDAVNGERVVQQSVPAILAQMPVLAESLAIEEHKTTEMKAIIETAPSTIKLPARLENGYAAKLKKEEPAATGNALEAKHGEQRNNDCCRGSKFNRNEDFGRGKKIGKNSPESRLDESSDSSGRGSRKKAPTKPVPFSALSSFKAVIFDLDGVIVDSEMVHPRTFERALDKYGVKIDNAHWKRVYTGIGSYAIFEDLVKKYKIKEDARELVKKRNDIYMKEIRKNKLPVTEGFAEVHKLLAQSGVKEIVASGGHINHVEESLRSSGLKNMPFVAIEQVRRGKPAPEIFLRAAKRLRVKPSECIVFEDALSGVEAAAAAGMPCVALSTTMPEKELRGKATLIVRNFKSKKLKRLLAILLARRGKASGRKKGGAKAKPRKLDRRRGK